MSRGLLASGYTSPDFVAPSAHLRAASVLEGDLDNARYWYERAKRTFSPDAKSELAAARQTLDA